jgi:hypothetical protein
MTNVNLEKGNVIIDRNIQEKMCIKKWIKIENVSHQRIFVSVLSAYFFILLSLFFFFPFPFVVSTCKDSPLLCVLSVNLRCQKKLDTDPLFLI